MMVTSGGAQFEAPPELNLQETCPASVVAVNEVPVRNPDRLKSDATWSAETEMQATGHAVPSDHRLRQSKLFLQNVFSITERLVHPGTQLLQISNVLNSIFHWYVHRVGMSSQGDGVALRDGRFATANAGGYRRWIIACWNPGVGVATPGTKDISFAFRKTVKLAMSRVKVQIGVWQGSSSVGLPVTCHIGQTGDLSDGPAGLEGGGMPELQCLIDLRGNLAPSVYSDVQCITSGMG